MNNASINEHYTHDHDRLDELFNQFQTFKASDRAKSVSNFQEFRSGLERHIVWEEEILFPSFEQKFGALGGPTQVMRWEHQEIRKHLGAISEKLARNNYDTEFEEAALQAVLCPHNHKEESILYPMIDQITDADERAEIFTRMSEKA